MRLTIIIMLFSLIYLVTGKNNVKSLTESMGQEVIEIGTPIKELPMGLEEEPSPDDEEAEKVPLKAIINTPATATKKDTKKTTTLEIIKKDVQDIKDKKDGLNDQDEEAKIEKELADIYKDTADYKSDSAEEKEVATESSVDQIIEEEISTEVPDKPVGRKSNNFKFHPDTTDKESVEKFRTSLDEITCDNKRKLSVTTPLPNSNKAFDTFNKGITLIAAVLCCVFICI